MVWLSLDGLENKGRAYSSTGAANDPAETERAFPALYFPISLTLQARNP